MINLIAFVIGAVFGSAVFYLGLSVGKREGVKEKTEELTKDERLDLERRRELDRQFLNMMNYSGRPRE